MKQWCGIFVACAFGCAGTAMAGRPLTVDDADPADQGAVEVECGLAYEKDSENHGKELALGLTYGLIPGLEVGVGFGGQRIHADGATESGATDTVLGAKWRFFQGSDSVPRQALAPSVKLPTADEAKGLGSGETDADLTWIASWSLADESIGVHLNAGYSWNGEPDGEEVGDVVHYGAAMDYALADGVQWVGEFFVEDERVSGADPVVMFNTGLRWEIGNVTFDLAGGAPVDGDGPDFTTTLGLTAAF